MARIPKAAAADSRRASGLLARRLRGSGWTQERAAEALGLSLSHLGRVLRGDQPLKVELLYRLLALIEVEPVDFFSELHGPAAAFPPLRLPTEREEGVAGPTINIFLLQDQLLAVARKAGRRITPEQGPDTESTPLEPGTAARRRRG
ncbi:MAG TPA: helix-turn-helix transcriptional regulator [Thermoanaerobaculia bacterium]|nr:helix-turn-helix transcriptional regulator [Thermoanaerobaculia bacterium]